KARGECVRILLGRSQDSNETLSCRSTVCSGTRQRSKRLQICASNQTTGRCRSSDRECCRFWDRSHEERKHAGGSPSRPLFGTMPRGANEGTAAVRSYGAKIPGS